MKNITFVIILLLLPFACVTKKNSTVAYKTIDLEESIPLSDNDPDSIHFRIELHFTELTAYSNKKVLEQVKKEFNKQFFEIDNQEVSIDPLTNFKELVENIAQSYRKEAVELKKDYGEMSYMLNYELIKESKIVYNNNNLLFLEVESYVYSGGAHGLGNKQYLHFNMRKGSSFGLNEVFYDGARPAISKMLQEKCETLQNSEDYMLFEEAAPEINENFYFDEENLYFVYNPYEIAPYAAGYVTLSLPIKNIANWIDKKGPMGFLN